MWGILAMGLELTRREEKTLKRIRRAEKHPRAARIAVYGCWLVAFLQFAQAFYDGVRIVVVAPVYRLSLMQVLLEPFEAYSRIAAVSPEDAVLLTFGVMAALARIMAGLFFLAVAFMLRSSLQEGRFTLKLHRRLQELGDLPGIEIAARADSQTTDDPDASAH